MSLSKKEERLEDDKTCSFERLCQNVMIILIRNVDMRESYNFVSLRIPLIINLCGLRRRAEEQRINSEEKEALEFIILSALERVKMYT